MSQYGSLNQEKERKWHSRDRRSTAPTQNHLTWVQGTIGWVVDEVKICQSKCLKKTSHFPALKVDEPMCYDRSHCRLQDHVR